VCSAVGGACTDTCATFQTTLTAAQNDDVFEIEEGLTCVLTATLTAPIKTGIVLRGLGSGATIDGNDAVASVIKVYTGAVVEQLAVRNSTGVGIEGNGGARAFTVQDVTLDQIDGSGIYRCTGTVERVTMTNIGGIAINSTTSSVTARNVRVSGAALGCLSAAGAATLVEHMTCADSPGGQYGIATTAGTVRYSVVANNTSSLGGLRAAVGEHNDVFGTTGGPNYYDGASQGTGSISADPLFVGGGDYSLTASSPAVDAATGSTVTDDLLGVTRDAAPDMGAYEYVAAGLPDGVWGVGGAMGTWGSGGVMSTRGAP
jgi:hypothetical protein